MDAPNPTPIDQLARDAVEQARLAETVPKPRSALGMMSYGAGAIDREPALAAFVLEAVPILQELAWAAVSFGDERVRWAEIQVPSDLKEQTRALLEKHGVEL